MQNLIIKSAAYPFLRIRTIKRQDLELLRKWKNDNRDSFFFREYITESMQEDWYRKYLRDDNGYMFMVEENMFSANMHIIGCMGYRQCSTGEIDLYNIIRGRNSMAGQKMSSAMRIMVTFISIWSKNITCKVLNENPAIQWYSYIGFEIKCQHEQYSILEPKKGVFIFDKDVQVLSTHSEILDCPSIY